MDSIISFSSRDKLFFSLISRVERNRNYLPISNFLWIIVTKKLLSSLGNGWFLRLLVSCHLFSPPSIWKSPWEAAWQDDRSIFIEKSGERDPCLSFSKIDNGSHVFNSILLCYYLLCDISLIIYLPTSIRKKRIKKLFTIQI